MSNDKMRSISRVYNVLYTDSYVSVEEDQRELGLIKEGPPIIRQSPTQQTPSPCGTPKKSVSIRVEPENDGRHLTIPKTIAVSSSSETLTGIVVNLDVVICQYFQYGTNCFETII